MYSHIQQEYMNINQAATCAQTPNTQLQLLPNTTTQLQRNCSSRVAQLSVSLCQLSKQISVKTHTTYENPRNS